MTTHSSSVPDLCLLVKQRNVTRLRQALEAHPALVKQQRWSGVTGLHRAVSENNIEIVELLLHYGIDVNQRSTWGWYSPLHLACKLGSEDMIRLLLKHGAHWNICDKTQKTPLDWAIRAGKASIASRIDQQQVHAQRALGNNDKHVAIDIRKLCG